MAASANWSFIDLAALGSNSLRSYALTLTAIVLAPMAFLAASFAAIFWASAAHLLTQAAAFTAALGIAFAAVVLIGGVLVWCVVRLHRRPALSLVSTDLTFDWRRFAIGAGVEGLLLLLVVAAVHFSTGQPWPSGAHASLAGLAAILLLVPFQAASEEMLFRGYLTQAFGRVLRSRVLIAAAVGILFAAIHMNAYGWWTTPYLCLLSLIYSGVSLRDGRLELVIGAHAANNWFGVGAVDTLAAVNGNEQLGLSAIVLLGANGLLFYALTRGIVRWLPPHPPPAAAALPQPGR